MSEITSRLSTALADRYQIERRLGEGGMATVFLAEDVKHDRKVALKVLKPELAAVLGADRFVQEIKTTAGLQHPHILPLFDSGEADGFLYYVMPYIEGETLRAKLDREHQLGIEEAVKIATEVADALDYAHRHGVIHRDIKPENILLHDGRPVVADFGIALAVSAAAGGRMTETGLSLGTPHYMSPEQATAEKEITARSDVYSLASVLYEMLSGVPPHEGGSAQQVIMRIIADTPRPVVELRRSVPPGVAAALDKALEKLPADRFATAAEFAAGLSQPGAVPAASRSLPAPSTAGRSAMLPWWIAGAAVVAAGVGWWIAFQPAPEEAVLRYEIPVPSNSTLPVGRGNTVAISPDGRFVLFAAQFRDGDARIYLRAADELQPREVPGASRALYPFFSPDGDWVGFWAGGQYLRAPVSGGATVVVGDAPQGGVATWTSSGWIVAAAAGGVLAKAPARGGTMTPFTTLDSAQGEATQLNPVAVADGKTVLYSSIGMGGAPTARIGVASLEDGATTILDLVGVFPLGVLDEHLVYVDAGGTIMAVPYDHAGRQITGPALALIDQTAVDAATPGAYAQMSLDGSLIYVSGATRRQLVVVSPEGVVRTIGQEAPLSWPRVSPDGKQVAVSLGSASQSEVWLFDLSTGSSTRMTTTGGINDRPEWTPDGKSILFRSSRESPNAIWIQSLDGSPARRLAGSAGAHVDEGVLSPDGRYLLIQRDSTGNGEIWFSALEGDTTPVRLTEAGSGDYGARFSPDGKWIAYTSGASGVAQVYVRAFPDLTRRAQVSFDGGTTPVWSADGTRIYYVNGSELWVATIGSTQPFTIASRSLVLDRGYTFNNVHADYDVMADGSIVALRSPSQQQQLVVVRHLDAELRARLRSTPR